MNWREPIVEDFSGHVIVLLQTHSSGSFFPIGTTTVSYIFRDHDNNMATCSFSVTVFAGMLLLGSWYMHVENIPT